MNFLWRKDHKLRLMCLKWQLNLSAMLRHLMHSQWLRLACPRIPQLDRTLSAKFHNCAGRGIHDQIHIAKADPPVQRAHSHSFSEHIRHKSILYVCHHPSTVRHAILRFKREGIKRSQLWIITPDAV